MDTLDPQVDDFLYDLVINYMQGAKMFTSLDITNQAKDAGHRVRNYQVADWLRRNVIVLAQANSFLYNQSLITVDSKAAGTTLAYVYHHYQDDTDDYLDRDQNPKSFKTVVPVAVVPAQSLPSFLVDPLQMIQGARQSVVNVTTLGELFFESRERARNYARNNAATYKFQDNGHYAASGERWSCIER